MGNQYACFLANSSLGQRNRTHNRRILDVLLQPVREDGVRFVGKVLLEVFGENEEHAVAVKEVRRTVPRLLSLLLRRLGGPGGGLTRYTDPQHAHDSDRSPHECSAYRSTNR